MNNNGYRNRRIFKSAVTSQNVIRELLQMIFLAELLEPSGEIWFVSPWISDVILLDNRSGGFDSINPDWRGREIRLSDITVHLLSRGSHIIVVTRGDEHNRNYLDKLRELAHESAVDSSLDLIVRDTLHTKGILSETGVLLGSMNITYNGMELNDEFVEYDTDRESIAKARLAFESYCKENAT